jgi:RNA polymerase sigma-70 factor (ECF subfamily)
VVPVKDFDQLFVSDKSEENHAADSALEIRFLAEAISALPRRCQEIFVLCRLESLSQKDVAKRLGISESTVAVQSARGLRRCEEFIRRRMKRG